MFLDIRTFLNFDSNMLASYKQIVPPPTQQQNSHPFRTPQTQELLLMFA